MIKTNAGETLTDVGWSQLLARQPGANFYAVITTGVVCRQSCPARTPLRKNVRVFASLTPALDAGFRTCKRCQPNTDQPASRAKASTAAVPSLELP